MAPPVKKPEPLHPLPLNCPMCGKKLIYLRNEGDVGFYLCLDDGPVVHPPDGRVRVVIH